MTRGKNELGGLQAALFRVRLIAQIGLEILARLMAMRAFERLAMLEHGRLGRIEIFEKVSRLGDSRVRKKLLAMVAGEHPLVRFGRHKSQGSVNRE